MASPKPYLALKKFFQNLNIAPFAVSLAIVAIISGIRGLVDPSAFPLHAVMHGLDYIWAIIFACGGAAMFFGMGFRKANVEAAGCALFFGGTLVEAVSFLFFLGFTRTTSLVTVLILMNFAIASLLRFRHLYKGDAQVWLGPRANKDD